MRVRTHALCACSRGVSVSNLTTPKRNHFMIIDTYRGYGHNPVCSRLAVVSGKARAQRDPFISMIFARIQHWCLLTSSFLRPLQRLYRQLAGLVILYISWCLTFRQPHWVTPGPLSPRYKDENDIYANDPVIYHSGLFSLPFTPNPVTNEYSFCVHSYRDNFYSEFSLSLSTFYSERVCVCVCVCVP